MKISLSGRLLVWTLASTVIHAVVARDDAELKLSEEDATFWDRFLMHYPSSLSPTPGPTPSPTGGACEVDVEVTCTTPEGLDCSMIEPPPSQCAIGTRFESLTFSYRNCLCPASVNAQPNPNANGESICVDGALLVEAPVFVECAGPAGVNMAIEPARVQPAGFFTITNPIARLLPPKLYCDIFDPETGTKLQTNIIDTSGTTRLDLEDKYGAMQLEGCNDQSCYETLCYNVDIVNIGENCMDLTLAEFIFNDQTTDLLPLLPVTSLCPEESASIQQKGDVNTCITGQFCAEVQVQADPPDPNAPMCMDSDILKFIIPNQPTLSPTFPPTPGPNPSPTPAPTFPPTPTPTFSPTPGPTPASTLPCVLDLMTDCVIVGGANAGVGCEAITPPILVCEERPTDAVFLYRGGDCSQSDNTQDPGKFECTDFGPGPPLSGPAYIIVTDSNGDGITYFQGPVEFDGEFNVNDNNERFESEMFIQIFSPDQSTLWQEVLVHTSCSQPFELSKRFGSVQLIEFFNPVQGRVSLLNTFDFAINVELPIDTSATGLVRLDTLIVTSNFIDPPVLDLSDMVDGEIIGPGMPLTPPIVLSGTIDASVMMRYTISFEATGFRVDNDQFCEGMSMDSFVVPSEDVPGPAPTGGSKVGKVGKMTNLDAP